MPISLALTITGRDQPGLVDSLSSCLTAHGANWQESRLASLAGQFAGIVLVSVPEANAEALKTDLMGLAVPDLTVMIAGAAETPGEDRRVVKLELVGQDHVGIVREISHALAHHGIGIDELETSCRSASWSGEILFEAKATLDVPAKVSTEQLREILEAIAHEIMVDITLDESL